MSDSFTETSNQGWFSRIVDSIKGVLIGLVLFVVAFPLLFWNEGRSVKTYKDLKEGEGMVVDVSADKVEPANQDKLVHLNGLATTDETLRDTDFGVEINALKLQRKSEIYQWQEKKSETRKKKLGGGEETVVTYDYDKAWVTEPINSSGFKVPEGHTNTANFEFASRTTTASKIAVGAFTLSPALVSSISNFEPLPAANLDLQKGSEAVKKAWKASGEWTYRGADAETPAIGDMRVRFLAAKPATVSLLAKQSGDSFGVMVLTNGTKLERLQMGTLTSKEMFEQAQAENAMLTWVLRGVGLFVMWLGITLIFKPLVVIADVVPFIGNLLQMGIGAFALMFALPLTLITIAIGWIAYRPVLGISLLAAAAVSFGLIFYLRRKKPAAA